MTKTYAPHQLRVIDELAELNSKITSLREFMKPSGAASKARVSLSERQRLSEQLGTMSKYADILCMRIADFDTPEDLLAVYVRPAMPTDADPLGLRLQEVVAVPLRRLNGPAILAKQPDVNFSVYFRRDLDGILLRTAERVHMLAKVGAKAETGVVFE